MTTTAQRETLGFQAEVKQLLHLMVHSLYGNKEIFLRELVSNASDAGDKLRFESLADPALFENDHELKIRVAYDKAARTITVSDNGIGMSRQEVVDQIGTIAKSGTREFFQSLTSDKAKDAHLIGQFGVGFYSSFIVAESVEVFSRRAGTPETEMVCAAVSASIRILSSASEGSSEGFDNASKRNLSHASDAFEINSRRKISLWL